MRLPKELNPLNLDNAKMVKALGEISRHLSPYDIDEIYKMDKDELRDMLSHNVGSMVYRLGQSKKCQMPEGV